MVKLIYAVTCDRAVVGTDNLVTLHNIFDELTISPMGLDEIERRGSPAWMQKRIIVACEWARSDDNSGLFDARIQWLLPSGQTFTETHFPIDFVARRRYRTFLELPAVLFGGLGRYSAQLEVLQAGQWQLAGATGFTMLCPERTPTVISPAVSSADHYQVHH